MVPLSRRGVWRWPVVALACVAAILLAYQVPYVCSVMLGTVRDGPFVEGFLERTGTEEYSFRWSQGTSTIVLPGVAWRQSQELMLRLSPGLRPPSAPAPEVTVLANDVEVARFEVAPGFRNYKIPLEAEVLGKTGILRVELHVPTFSWNGRALGVVVEKVRLRPSDEGSPGLALPPVLTTLAWAFDGCLLLALLIAMRLEVRPWGLMAALAGGAIALALGTALAREWMALAPGYACGALGVGYALARQFPRWRDQAGPRERRTLAFLTTLGIENPALRTRVEIGLAALVVAHFVVAVLLPLRSWGPKDLLIYQEAASRWLEGRDYYEAFTRGTGFIFTNPPSGAAFYAPLARLPVKSATTVWRGLNVALLATAGLLLWSSTRGSSGTSPSPVWLVLMLAYSEPLRITLRMGQVGILVLFLLALCLWGFARRKPIVTGMSLAAAAAIKVLPGFPLIYFLWRRDWRTTRAAVVSGSLLLAVVLWSGGLAPWRVFLGRVLPAISAPRAYFGNQSLVGFLQRAAGSDPGQDCVDFTSEPECGTSDPAWRFIGYGVALGTIALTAWWMRRHDDADPLHRTLEVATTIPIMLLVAPLVWEFYLMWLILTIHVILAVLNGRSLTALGQIAVVATLASSWALMQLDTTDTYRLPGWPVPLMSLGLYAVVLVFGCCLYLLGQAGRVSAPPSD
jgi:hypothetical protein